MQRRSVAMQIAIGVVCAVIGTGLRVLLSPHVGHGIPWATYFAAVLTAGLLGGTISGVIALGSSVIAALYVVMAPRVLQGNPTTADLVSILTFIVVAAGMVAVGARLRRLLREATERSVALERLYAVGELCAKASTPHTECLEAILRAAIETTGAQKGTLQIHDAASETLVLVAHAGFEQPFLDFFARVKRGHGAACGAAFAAEERVIVEDVNQSPVFAGHPSLQVLLEQGVRAVQSTPLISSTGNLLGMVATHFTHAPHRPADDACRLLDLLARKAANYLERTLAEDALRKATEGLRVVTDGMATLVTRCSRELTYVWVSRPYAEWIRRPVEDIAGKPIVDVIGSSAFKALRPHFEKVLSGEVVRFEEEIPFQDLGARWVLATYTPTFDAGGACDGWVAAVSDITDRKRVEEALADANRRKDEFLAMLGHELRNPLAAIRNAVATASLDASHRDEALAIARRQTEQLGRLVDDLLDVARITQGRIALQRKPMPLQLVVRTAVAACRPFCDERGHTLDVDLPLQDAYVNGDATRLEQVLVNLLSNACKYTNPGGRVSLALEVMGGEAIVRVRDTGIGIAPDMLPHVFELFTQAQPSLDRPQGGLGIGLTIAQRIVELHGGRIEASSPGLGRGAEFVARLPVLEAVELPATPVVSLPMSATEPPRVLLVEDNVDSAESLRLLLECLGYRVCVTASGMEALAAAPSFHPDLMLIDIGLPGMDGYETARRLRQQPELAGVRMVALTGYGREEDKRASADAGFDVHLVKPVDPHHIEQVLHGLPASGDTVH